MGELMDSLARDGAIVSVTWALIEPGRNAGQDCYVISVLCELADRPGMRYIGALETDPHRAGERLFECLSCLPDSTQSNWAERIQNWTLRQPSPIHSLSLYNHRS